MSPDDLASSLSTTPRACLPQPFALLPSFLISKPCEIPQCKEVSQSPQNGHKPPLSGSHGTPNQRETDTLAKAGSKPSKPRTKDNPSSRRPANAKQAPQLYRINLTRARFPCSGKRLTPRFRMFLHCTSASDPTFSPSHWTTGPLSVQLFSMTAPRSIGHRPSQTQRKGLMLLMSEPDPKPSFINDRREALHSSGPPKAGNVHHAEPPQRAGLGWT